MDYSSVIYIVSFIFRVFTYLDVIFSAILAIITLYLFLFKRKDILLRYNILLNYTFQMSQQKLLGKIGDVRRINADEEPQKVNVILFDIKGQMKGNPILTMRCKPILAKLSKFEKHPDLLTNCNVIGLMAELEEKINYINIKSYNELLGEKKDE